MNSLRTAAIRAFKDFLYVVLAAPLGLAWLIVLITLFAVGLGTSVVFVGLAILAFTYALMRWGANVERERAALVLGRPIARPPKPRLSGGLGSRWMGRLRDRATWREFLYLLALGPVGIACGSIVAAGWSLVVAGLAAPALVSSAPHGSLLSGVHGTKLAAVLVGAVLLALLTLVVMRGLAAACGAMASALLAPDERAVLAARVETLETTRMGAVESADARLRRLERDLHDGAQHRLAYIAMELDRARSKLGEDPDVASTLLAGAHEESKRAMAELRDLVRGIHPSVLTDRGLDAAVSGLAERCPVPVDVTVALDQRPPTAIETAAYYVVAEALTNIGRHSGASAASVDVRRALDRLIVEVRDNGHGGAARAAGSGLEGLAQRVEALDGKFTIQSPDGGPTSIRAELPCAW